MKVLILIYIVMIMMVSCTLPADLNYTAPGMQDTARVVEDAVVS